MPRMEKLLLSNLNATLAIRRGYIPPAPRGEKPAAAPARFRDLPRPASPEPWPTAKATLGLSSTPDQRGKATDPGQYGRAPASRLIAISPAPLTSDRWLTRTWLLQSFAQGGQAFQISTMGRA